MGPDAWQEGELFEPVTEVIPAVRLAGRHPAAVGLARSRRARAAPRWLEAGVAGLGVLLALGIGGLALEHARPSVFSSLQSAPALPPLAAPAPRPVPVRAGASPGALTHTPASTPSRAASAPPTVAGTGQPAGDAPLISALRPSTGNAGTELVVTGSGFHSPSGVIVVTFDGAAAPTRCPSQGQCLATVPHLTAPARALVRVTTDAGSSNALAFSYR
jgi:hypothetical protein